MISLDNSHTSKSEVKSSTSTLSLGKTKDEPTLSFSELLQGIKVKDDTKDIKNGVVVLDLKDTSIEMKKDEKSSPKNEALLSLLKNDDRDIKTSGILEIDTKIIESISDKLTIKEVKSLIFEAKKYLKSKIEQTEAFKKSELKELPKTLKGLIKIADKFGVDLSKITIEKIKAQNVKSDLDTVSLDAKEIKKDLPTNNLNTKEQTSNEVSMKTPKKVDNVEKKELQNNPKMIDKEKELPKNILNQPLFKAVNKKQFSTQELIQAREVKEVKVDIKTSKDKADETLRMLLSGDKAEKKAVSLSSDISVASAKVIMPETKSKVTKGLESLLHVDSNSKSEHLISTHKVDSLEVKLNEAKQMVKYLSQDVKQAIEDYKSPFTRIKVQLNPHKLGEVDLTVIQRGKNLIVNLSSNNSAINTLAMNMNELRTQLNNNGINNATLNFNNNAQSEQQNSSGQQNNQHEQREAQREYNYFDNEEQNEEVLSSLEIVVPNYA